jgi:hypothetical protein
MMTVVWWLFPPRSRKKHEFIRTATVQRFSVDGHDDGGDSEQLGLFPRELLLGLGQRNFRSPLRYSIVRRETQILRRHISNFLDTNIIANAGMRKRTV